MSADWVALAWSCAVGGSPTVYASGVLSARKINWHGLKDERILSLLYCGTRKSLYFLELFTLFLFSHCGKLTSSECQLYITQVYCNFVRHICYLSKKINVQYEQHLLYVWFSARSKTKNKYKAYRTLHCYTGALSPSLTVSLSLSLSLSLSHTHTHTHTHKDTNESINVGSVHHSDKISA
jgi:hypothetical protein